MKTFSFTKEEIELIYTALCMRTNLVQTGVPELSPADVANIGTKAAEKEFGAEIKALSVHQMELVIASKKLVEKILS